MPIETRMNAMRMNGKLKRSLFKGINRPCGHFWNRESERIRQNGKDNKNDNPSFVVSEERKYIGAGGFFGFCHMGGFDSDIDVSGEVGGAGRV